MKSRTYASTPTPVLAFLPSLLTTKTNRPQYLLIFFLVMPLRPLLRRLGKLLIRPLPRRLSHIRSGDAGRRVAQWTALSCVFELSAQSYRTPAGDGSSISVLQHSRTRRWPTTRPRPARIAS